MSQKQTTTAKLYAFLLAGLFIFGGLTAITPTTKAQTTPVLRVTELDYTTPATAIFGDGIGYVVVTHAASDTTDERDQILNVEISASSATTTKLRIDLLETGPKTGVFTGSFRVNSTNPTTDGAAFPPYGKILGDGTLRVQSGDTITVTSTSPAATVSNVKWFPSMTGNLAQFSNVARTTPISGAPPITGWNSLIFYRVTDSDLNRITTGTGARETHLGLLRVWSDSDPIGELLPLTETGDNTGVFDASVGFEAFRVINNTKVFVQGGDFVYAAYQDTRNEVGIATRAELAPREFLSATDGLIFFESGTVAGNINAISTGTDRITLVVFDTDVDTSLDAERPLADVSVGTSATCRIPLSERSPGGVYMATLGFRGVASGTGGCGAFQSPGTPLASCTTTVTAGCFDPNLGAFVLPLPGLNPQRQTLTANYADATDAGGVPRLLEATAQWVPAQNGDITIATSKATQRLVGTLALHTIQVVDFDADRNPALAEKITVRVKSDSDPNGVSIELTEDNLNSGRFIGTFGFTTASSSGANLRVADRDLVVATYDDLVGANGRAVRVLSEQSIVWRTATSATISSDSSTYFYAIKAGNADLTKPDVRARVFVEDHDRNDPRVRDEVVVQAVTLVPAGTTPKTATIVLEEVGVNSGIFTGVLAFSTTDDSTRLTVGLGSQNFRFEYNDPNGAAQTPTLSASPTIAWRKITDASRVVRMEVEDTNNFRARDVLPITARGSTNSPPPAVTGQVVLYMQPGPATVNVEILSGRCPEAKTFTLLDGTGTDAGDGRYSLPVRFVNFRSDPQPTENCDVISTEAGAFVGIGQTDTITIRGGPQVSTQVVSRASAASSTNLKDVLGADLSFTVPGRGEQLPFMIDTSASNDNLFRGGREVLTLTVASRTTAQSAAADDLTDLLLVETSEDSGQFVGSFLVSETGTNQDVNGDLRGDLTIHVSSDLQHAWAFFPESARSLARAFDTVTVSGRGSDTMKWIDADRPSLTITSDAWGLQGAFTLRLQGDDINTRRITGDLLTSGSLNQRTFNLKTPYVPGSEHVFTTSTELVSGSASPGTAYTVQARAGTAAEPIADRDGNGAINCQDVEVTGSGVTGTTWSCGSVTVNPTTDVWSVNVICAASSAVLCSSGSGSLRYTYRAAHSTDPLNKFQYSRANDTQIRFGLATGETLPAGQQVTVDYTPQFQVVTVTSASDTETAFVRWNQAEQAYIGSIGVEASRTVNNGRIQVSGNQAAVAFRFDDPHVATGRPASTDPTHFSAITASGLWRTGGNAAIAFLSPDFAQTVTHRAFGPSIPVRVTDIDSDRTSQSDALVIQAQRTGSSDIIEVVLRESHGTSGVFTGLVPISLTPSPGRLQMASGDFLTVRYVDPFGDDGREFTAAAQIRWQPAQTAQITTSPVNTILGASGKLTVTITDADANRDNDLRDKIKIRVVSDGDTVGEEFEITESSVPGVFTSEQIGFESGAAPVPNNKLVFARDNGYFQDRIFVIYDDVSNIQGRSVTQRHGPLFWDLTHDGRVNLEFDQYFGTHVNRLQVPALAGLRPYATVTVAEGDCNTSPGRVDFIEIKSDAQGGANHPCDLRRFSLRVAQSSGGTGDSTLPLPNTFKLVETGANTGIFLASITFNTSAPPAVDGGRNSLRVSNNDLIRASFTDANPAGGVNAFEDEARWYSHGFGVIRLSAPGFNDASVKPTVTLVDGNAPTTVTVRVTSRADTTGIDVTLTQVPANSGFYSGQFELTSAASGAGKIRVQNVDEIQVVYNDASPSGSRSAFAAINLADKTPPTTSLLTTPAQPDGLNGVFKQKPSIRFSSSEQGKTFFRIGASTTDLEWTGQAIELDEGAHVVRFHSVDVFGNIEAQKNRTIEVDLTDPTATVGGLAGRAIAAGRVQLNWTGVAETSPSDFFRYVVFRDGAAAPIGNSTSANFTDATLTDENVHTYRVAVEDKSGRRGPLSGTVSVTPDKTLPLLSAATITPSQFDLRRPPAAITVSVTVSDANLNRVEAAIVEPAGTVLKTANLTAQSGVFRGTLDPNVTQPCTCEVVFSAFDNAGNKGETKLALRITGPDTQAPVITISNIAANGEVVVGTAVTVSITDNVALKTVRYVLDNQAPVTVELDATPEDLTFAIATTALSLGLHTLRIDVEDNATDENGAPTPNRVSMNRTFVIVERLSGEPGTPSALFLVTRAEPQSDGKVKVSWDVPPALSNVAGYQVWRAASPFVLIANVSDPNARSFVDSAAIPGTIYRYVVTAFTSAPFARLSEVPGYPGNDDAVPGSNPVQATEEGLPQWLWLVLGALALIAVAVIVAVPLMARQRRPNQANNQQLVEPEAAPLPPEPEPAVMGQTHRLRCPQCSHRFEVTGSKPIVTSCPNCGRKGILR